VLPAAAGRQVITPPCVSYCKALVRGRFFVVMCRMAPHRRILVFEPVVFAKTKEAFISRLVQRESAVATPLRPIDPGSDSEHSSVTVPLTRFWISAVDSAVPGVTLKPLAPRSLTGSVASFVGNILSDRTVASGQMRDACCPSRHRSCRDGPRAHSYPVYNTLQVDDPRLDSSSPVAFLPSDTSLLSHTTRLSIATTMSKPNYMFECTAANATLTSPCCVTANGTLNSANMCLNNGPGIFRTCAAPVDQQLNTTAINEYSSCRQTGGAGVLTLPKLLLLALCCLTVFANARSIDAVLASVGLDATEALDTLPSDIYSVEVSSFGPGDMSTLGRRDEDASPWDDGVSRNNLTAEWLGISITRTLHIDALMNSTPPTLTRRQGCYPFEYQTESFLAFWGGDWQTDWRAWCDVVVYKGGSAQMCQTIGESTRFNIGVSAGWRNIITAKLGYEREWTSTNGYCFGLSSDCGCKRLWTQNNMQWSKGTMYTDTWRQTMCQYGPAGQAQKIRTDRVDNINVDAGKKVNGLLSVSAGGSPCRDGPSNCQWRDGSC
jgi:hypothetical protein